METNLSLYWVPKYVILSQKCKNLKTVIEDLRNMLMHGLVPRVTASIVNTLHERPRLLSVQLKLSNIKSDLKNKLSLCKPMYFNSFLSNIPFLYPLKRSENLWFSELLRRSGGSIGRKWVKLYLYWFECTF